MTLEDDLRSALHHHADQVEPSADGLERIEARLAGPPALRPRLAPRLLAAAALLVAVGAVGAMTFRSAGDGDIDLAVPSSTTDPSAAEVSNELPPLNDEVDAATSNNESSSVSEATPNTPPDIPPAPAGILGPRSVSPGTAINSFLGLIQRGGEDFSWEIEDGLALVSRLSEGGDMVDVTTLQLGSVEMPDGTTGYVVVQALSPRIVIESPSLLSTTTESVLTVSGQGEGFEAVVDVELFSSRDGVWLNRGFANAGSLGVVAPFITTLDVSGSGPAWVVVQSSGGTDTALDPFAAVPVVIDAPRANPAYRVTNIPAGDPDGGLVVRSLPGTDGDQLVILPAGESSVHKRAALSVFIGDGEPSYGLEPTASGQQEWWNVWFPEPLENGRDWGWVNSRYLTDAEAVSDADLEAIGWQFVDGLRGDDAAFAAMPWSADGVTFGLSSDLVETTSGKAALPEFWQDTMSFTPPPALSGELVGSLREVLSPTRVALAPETAVEVGIVPILELSPYSVVNEALAARFAGASVVRLTDPANDGSGWRLVNLFVQPGAAGPEIVGMVAVEWTP